MFVGYELVMRLVMKLVYRVEHKETRIGPFQTNTPFTQDLSSMLFCLTGHVPGFRVIKVEQLMS